MTDLLTASDLLVIRRRWIGDEIDEHLEFGAAGSTTVGSAATLGSSSIHLHGLGTGTIHRGTPFAVTLSGVQDRYVVTADATITSNQATVSVSPLVARALSGGELVSAEPYARSVYNKVNFRQGARGGLLFSDIDLQDFAIEASERWAARIASAPDRQQLYRGVTLLAVRQMTAPGSEFFLACQVADPTGQGRSEMDRLDKLKAELEKELTFSRKGPGSTDLYL
jgi:hypothetical protein